MTEDVLLAGHVAAGIAALGLGAAVLWTERMPAERSPASGAYGWAVVAVAVTALGLVAGDPARLWWLAPPALFAVGLAYLGVGEWGRTRSVRAWAHGQGGSYIALVTATLVVVLDGSAAVAAWVVPTALGLALIELRVTRARPGTA